MNMSHGDAGPAEEWTHFYQMVMRGREIESNPGLPEPAKQLIRETERLLIPVIRDRSFEEFHAELMTWPVERQMDLREKLEALSEAFTVELARLRASLGLEQ